MKSLIKTEEEFDQTLVRIYELMQSKKTADSPEYKELDELADAVETYEERFHPISSRNK